MLLNVVIENENDNGGGILNKETVGEVVEGDGVKVDSSVISTTYETGNEVGNVNGLNDREVLVDYNCLMEWCEHFLGSRKGGN